MIQEQPNEVNFQAEPVAPVLTAFVKHAGDQSGRTADYDAYIRDLEERSARTAAFQEQRRKQNEQASRPIDVVAELDNALTALEAGASDFENSYGKPNQPLIDAKLEVERLRAELAEAEARLSAIEARGDSVDRLAAAVRVAEGALNGLLRTAEEKAMRKLATAKFGWEAPMQKVKRETLRELALDISVQSLRQFAIQQHRGTTNDVTLLRQRMDVVGRKLAELRDHLEPETV
jgi:chromosome segregation ATPase